jgi:clan AA aspartic protease
VKLANPRLPDLAPIEVKALADTGAVHLCLPKHVVLQLQLEEHEKREVTLADGSHQLVPYVGPVEVSFANRLCFTGAMVFGDEALLGAIPMEDMDLVVLPKTHEVAVNPANPNFAVSIAKGLPPSRER